MERSSKIYLAMLALAAFVFCLIIFYFSKILSRTEFINFVIVTASVSGAASVVFLTINKKIGRAIFPREKNYEELVGEIEWKTADLSKKYFIISYCSFIFSFGVFFVYREGNHLTLGRLG